MRFLAITLLVAAACRPPGYGKGDDDVDAAPNKVDAAVSTDGGPDSATSCVHGFRLDGYATAQSVWLTGDFVMWGGNPSAGALPFVLGQDGGWTVMHTFNAGPAQYKFIVDSNNWIADPTNPNQIDDGFGGKNSVYTCVP